MAFWALKRTVRAAPEALTLVIWPSRLSPPGRVKLKMSAMLTLAGSSVSLKVNRI